MSLGFRNLRRRAILLAAMAGPALGETPVRVRLYDYAGVPPRILDQAQAYASTLFSEAGIAMEWARCSPGESGVPGDAACRPPFDPLNLEIRILSREMAKRAHTTEHALGYALLAPGFHHVAAVFYHRALELEKACLAGRSDILGAVLAHEIGHLLLAQPHHPPTGIMCARWGDEVLKLIQKGRLRFTAGEARAMARMLSQGNRARSQRAVAALLPPH
ncbi:MAG: hypothetical protein IT158_13330 [Bryobacterales bacterium]|nr:hypothetical protein [Bryobacterales bacterium]